MMLVLIRGILPRGQARGCPCSRVGSGRKRSPEGESEADRQRAEAWTADVSVKRVSTDTHERLTAHTSPSLYTESTGILPVFPWGVLLQSQGLQKNAGAHTQHPATGELSRRLLHAGRKARVSCHEEFTERSTNVEDVQ